MQDSLSGLVVIAQAIAAVVQALTAIVIVRLTQRLVRATDQYARSADQQVSAARKQVEELVVGRRAGVQPFLIVSKASVHNWPDQRSLRGLQFTAVVSNWGTGPALQCMCHMRHPTAEFLPANEPLNIRHDGQPLDVWVGQISHFPTRGVGGIDPGFELRLEYGDLTGESWVTRVPVEVEFGADYDSSYQINAVTVRQEHLRIERIQKRTIHEGTDVVDLR